MPVHVLGGGVVIANLFSPGRLMGFTDPARFTNRVEFTGLFWHFITVLWLCLFLVFYLL